MLIEKGLMFNLSPAQLAIITSVRIHYLESLVIFKVATQILTWSCSSKFRSPKQSRNEQDRPARHRRLFVRSLFVNKTAYGGKPEAEMHQHRPDDVNETSNNEGYSNNSLIQGH